MELTIATTLPQPVARPRAGAADLGLNPVSQGVLVGQFLLLAFLTLATAAPFPIAWNTIGAQVSGIAALVGIWSLLYAAPGRSPKDWMMAETLAGLILILSGSLIMGAGQYLVLTWDRPLIDATLARWDAALGVYVPALVAWARPSPLLTAVLGLAYFTLLPQFVIAILGTGVVLRNRARLWEFVFHFHVCGLVTLLMSGLFPAACAFTYYGFDSLLDQSRFIAHFTSLRADTFAVLRFDDIEGLISFPSFHVAGALIVTWAFRGYRRWFAPLVVLNAALIAATVLLGAHYAVDILATVTVFAVSVGAWRLIAPSLRTAA